MKILHTNLAHTCVDQPILPCPACVAAQPVLHPEHGYYKPEAGTTNFPRCKGVCFVCGFKLKEDGSCSHA